MVSRPTVQVLLLVVFFCANFLLFCFYRENSGGPHKVTVSQDWTDGGRNFSWEETHLVIDSNVSFAVVGKDEDEERDENEEAQNAPGASSPASASLEQLMAERQLRMRMGCDLMSSRSPSSITHNYQNVLLIRDDEGNDRENSLLWCPVFKASSSTWLHYLLDTTSTLTQTTKIYLRGKFGEAQPLKLVTGFSYRLDAQRFRNFVRTFEGVTALIIVRHPFHRLVSAFRDKLERYSKSPLAEDFYYRNYGRGMVARHRKAALRKFGSDFFKAKNNFGAPVPLAEGHRRSPSQPCFWEFVQQVLLTAPAKMDEHWRPMYHHCSVCAVRYNKIVLFENLETGEGEFVKHLINPGYTVEEKHVNANPTGLSSDELVNAYFSLLAEEDVEGLYKLYEYDFRLFGYKFQFRNVTYPH